jgi:hypothetical protein
MTFDKSIKQLIFAILTGVLTSDQWVNNGIIYSALNNSVKMS